MDMEKTDYYLDLKAKPNTNIQMLSITSGPLVEIQGAPILKQAQMKGRQISSISQATRVRPPVTSPRRLSLKITLPTSSACVSFSAAFLLAIL